MVTASLQTHQICKTTKFKNILMDIMYCYRLSVKRLTNSNVDIRLDKIKTQMNNLDNTNMIQGRIGNLFGGNVWCLYEPKFRDHIDVWVDYPEPMNIFAHEFFDNLTTVSKNGIIEFKNHRDGFDSIKNIQYFIRFIVKIIDENGKVISTTFTVAVDEITCLYFSEN